MAPTHIRCNKCGHLLRKGTKQYSKLKKSLTENYCGLPIFYISFRCSACKTEIALKTDPKSNFYLPMKGCTLPFLQMEKDKTEKYNELIETEKLTQVEHLEKIILKNIKANKHDKYIEKCILNNQSTTHFDPNLIFKKIDSK